MSKVAEALGHDALVADLAMARYEKSVVVSLLRQALRSDEGWQNRARAVLMQMSALTLNELPDEEKREYEDYLDGKFQNRN